MWCSLVPRPLQYRDGKPGNEVKCGIASPLQYRDGKPGNEVKCGIASFPGHCSTGMESWGNGLGMRLSAVRERESSTVVTYLDLHCHPLIVPCMWNPMKVL